VALALLQHGYALIMPMRGDNEEKPLAMRLPKELLHAHKQPETVET
jgi:hypothetical protein